MTELKYWQAVNSALREELSRDERVHVFGEDVGSQGGPFGATMKLQKEFGEWRVRDTPISEATITGIAVGSAMTGLRPVVEIMYMDFMTLALDQLVNQAAKMSYMSAGGYHVPLTLRTLCGSHRGSGPQHGQSLEAWLAAVPGLKVVWSSNPGDAKGLLKAAIRDDDPVVVIESLSMWGRRGPVDEDPDHVVPIGVGNIVREGIDLTAVAWGSSVDEATAAADVLADEGISVEVLDLRTISPLDVPLLVSSVGRTGRLLVVQDATGPFSVGSEVIRVVTSSAFDSLRCAPQVVSPPFAPVPAPSHLEKAFFPRGPRVAERIREIMEASR